MSDQLSRRDFLKVMGISAATLTILTGCGPDSRYVVREPYTKMPEYAYNGLSTEYASTCRECPAGCGIVVRTMQGRALKIEGNPNHPVNLGKTCARGQAALQGLYNPDRLQHPFKHARGGANPVELTWEQAVTAVKQALTTNQPDEIAFLHGMTPDHLADLVTEITTALGAPAPLRYGAFAMFEGRSTLVKASEQALGLAAIPFFDLGNSDLIFSFGANFLETYLSPVAFGRGYADMRKGNSTGKRGVLVQFEPRLSQTAAAADYWIPIIPGTQGLAAMGLGRAIAELHAGNLPAVYQSVDLSGIAEATGVSLDMYKKLAGMFKAAAHPLALPGGSALAASNGLEAGQAILRLNLLADNPGVPDGIFGIPELPTKQPDRSKTNTFKDIQTLVDKMKNGKIKTLFIHGINPIFELPASLGFAAALAIVPTVISFASFPDETALQADYAFPDHTGLESWGYQKIVNGADRSVLSGAQPVVIPLYNTKATADVLLAAVQAIGGSLATMVPYKDEVEFLQSSIQGLLQEPGYFNAPDSGSFWAQWQQYGGWWSPERVLVSGAPPSTQTPVVTASQFDGKGDYYLFPFLSPLLSDGSGANKPWLQETPDPTTTVMWNTWIEIHPDTADKLDLKDDDVVKVTSAFGELEASVYRYPAIRPDTIAIPFGQGHTAFGRYAQERGANLASLLGARLNAAGDLATSALKVNLTKTGKKRPLARFESVLGVYGNFTP